MRTFLIQGFRLFNSSINIVLTFEFNHNITILKMAIFDKFDYIKIEPPIHVCQSIAVISYTVLQPATQIMFQLVRTTKTQRPRLSPR